MNNNPITNKKNKKMNTPSKPDFKIIITPEILSESMSDIDLTDFRRFHVNNLCKDGSSYHLNETFEAFKKDIKGYSNYLSVISKQYKDLHFDFMRSATISIRDTDLKKFLSDDRVAKIRQLPNNLLWLTKEETTDYLKNVIRLSEVI